MTTTRRALLALGAVAVLALAPNEGRAAPGRPFSAEAFAAAQEGGRPILIAVAAPWCPICRTQKPILAKLAEDPRCKGLEIFEIDFDTQKDLMRRFDARQQSTLIAFKGATEVGRSVGETQPEWIESLLEKML
ncbi:thioredoxin family protein [Methylobacterium segetis]|uniref:thioredoxin family protein n=1 Tax=Methylobacterium segetis TaxID=2488750 RepID=UPI00104DFB86|nr:thioredoxin family protein [Methylobacterium segetis]